MNVPEEELREMVGASLVPATEAVKEARVLVAGEELESVTPRSKTRFPDVEGLSEVFLYSRALRRASACASVRVPPPSLAKVRDASLSSRDGSGDGVGDAAQADIGDGGAIVEVEIDRCHRIRRY